MGEDTPDGRSVLTIVPVEKLQKNINKTIKGLTAKGIPGVYVCFNRPQRAANASLEKEGIDTGRVFFIDCIATSLGNSSGKAENTVHVQSPADLTSLRIAIDEFIEKIPGRKFLVVDALATLLIYNSEELVLKFVKSLMEMARKDIEIFVLTPDTKGGELINKVSLFFDEVKKE